MDIMTLAMCKPKVIDLDKLGLTEALLGLAMAGGGSEAGDSDTFWEEANTDRPIVIQFTLDALLIKCAVSTTVSLNDIQSSLIFESFLQASDLSLTRVTVIIGRVLNDPTAVNFNVKVSAV